MRNVTNEFLDKLKVQVLDAASWLPLVEREEFYNNLYEWAYGKYEETLLRQESGKKQEDENR